MSRDELLAFITAAVRLRLGTAADDGDGDLFEAGLDSVEAVEITGEIEDRFGLSVDPALLFEARSVNALADAVLAAATAQN